MFFFSTCQIEKLGSWYSCNPLWAQLGDLYGALGTPAKVAHTVVAGDPEKSDLINSVLSFLSYFIRSGVIRKRREYRCRSQQDVREATDLLEQTRGKRPYLFGKRRSLHACNENTRDTAILRSRKPTQSIADTCDINASTPRFAPQHPGAPEERPRISRSVSPLKRSCTMKSDLDALATKGSTEAPQADLKLPKAKALFQPREHRESEKYDVPMRDDRLLTKDDEKYPASDKVKIIVSEIGNRQEDVTPKDRRQSYPQYSLRCFEKKLEDAREIEESLATGKAGSEPHRQPECDAYPLKAYLSRPELPLDADRGFVVDEGSGKDSQVLFALGADDKSATKTSLPGPRLGNGSCQCSYTFTRVPSTSAQLPEGVLRKIIQRNFPESSKSMQPPPGATSGIGARSIGFCLRCNGQGYPVPQDYDGSKQVLETPTNATEVLRTCGSTVGRNVGMSRSNSLEALMEANSVVELPMPRSVWPRSFLTR